MRSSLKFLFSTEKSAAKVNDDALIQEIKQGSELAFSSLYNAHVQELFDYGMQVCDDADFVKNCLKELFVHVWIQRHDLSVVITVKAYLFKSFRKLFIEKLLTRNFTVRVINFSRTELKFRLVSNSNVIGDQVSPFDNDQIIQELAGREAEALFLKINNRFSYDEVAFVMDLDVSIIYGLTSASVETLRRRMRNIVNVERPQNVFKTMEGTLMSRESG